MKIIVTLKPTEQGIMTFKNIGIINVEKSTKKQRLLYKCSHSLILNFPKAHMLKACSPQWC
jgi:hypothetical protein